MFRHKYKAAYIKHLVLPRRVFQWHVGFDKDAKLKERYTIGWVLADNDMFVTVCDSVGVGDHVNTPIYIPSSMILEKKYLVHKRGVNPPKELLGRYPACRVQWFDASQRDGWSKKDPKTEWTQDTDTVGWLIAENDDSTVISSTISKGWRKDDFFIPRPMIGKRNYVGLPGGEDNAEEK